MRRGGDRYAVFRGNAPAYMETVRSQFFSVRHYPGNAIQCDSERVRHGAGNDREDCSQAEEHPLDDLERRHSALAGRTPAEVHTPGQPARGHGGQGWRLAHIPTDAAPATGRDKQGAGSMIRQRRRL